MLSILVNLKDNDSVNDFVNLISGNSLDMDLSCTNSKQVVDAKSIIGVLSLDRTQAVLLTIHTEDKEKVQEIKELLKDYII